MAYYNSDKIYANLTGMDVAEKLQLPIFKKGNRYQILCTNPEHNDSHIGNCVLNQKGCFCFACGKQTNLESMVMNVLGVDFKEALKILATWAGIKSEKTVVKDIPPLTAADYEKIGLYPNSNAVFNVSNAAFFSKKMYQQCKIRKRDNNGDMLFGENEMFSLTKLYREDKYMYLRMCQGKIRERWMAIQRARQDYNTPKGKAFLFEIAKVTYSDFDKIAEKEISELHRIWDKLKKIAI